MTRLNVSPFDHTPKPEPPFEEPAPEYLPEPLVEGGYEDSLIKSRQQQQQSAPPSDFQSQQTAGQQESNRQRATGTASDVNDLFLTMNGVVNGDPVGLETFDLGFYEDGTPAIFINGAPVPIEHNQWMALMGARDKSRGELKQRIEFGKRRTEAKSLVMKSVAAMPQLQGVYGEALMSLAELDPDSAIQKISELGVAFARDGGREAFGDTTYLLKLNQMKPTMDRYFAKTITPEDRERAAVGLSKGLEATGMSAIESSTVAAKGAKNNELAYALSSIESMMYPPQALKARNGKPLGFFDGVAMQGYDMSAGVSQFAMLQTIAGSGDALFGGMIVPKVNAPAQGASAEEVLRYREYLMQLDNFAATVLHWDRSTPEAMDGLIAAALTKVAPMQSSAQPAAAVAPTTTPLAQPNVQPAPVAPTRNRNANQAG